MKIAIVGAGGLGGYLGALLARAGHEVALVARGEHLHAIREHGLTIESVHGDFAVRPIVATDRPAEIGPVDLVVFAVKTYDTDEAAEGARALIGADTVVLPIQNGVESAVRLAPYFGADRVLPGAAWIVVSVARPGVIRQESQVRRIVFAEGRGAGPVRDALASSGFTVEVSPAIETVLWTKLLFIASIAGVTSLTRATVGTILADTFSRALLRRAMSEVDAVARAQRIPLEPEAVDRAMAFAATLEPGATSSMARDVAAGRRSEHDALCGAVVRAGWAHGVPTPVHETFDACLATLERAARR